VRFPFRVDHPGEEEEVGSRSVQAYVLPRVEPYQRPKMSVCKLRLRLPGPEPKRRSPRPRPTFWNSREKQSDGQEASPRRPTRA